MKATHFLGIVVIAVVLGGYYALVIYPAVNDVVFRGTITVIPDPNMIGASTWTINNMTVVSDSNAHLATVSSITVTIKSTAGQHGYVESGLQVGTYVEVKGSYQSDGDFGIPFISLDGHGYYYLKKYPFPLPL